MSDRIPRGEARGEILKATWTILGNQGAAAATMVGVAKKAGVSRQAVYLFFGSRGGLLNAAMRDHDARSGLEGALRRAAVRRPAAEALMAVTAEWLRYNDAIAPVAGAMMAAAVTDPEAREAWDERMMAIRAVFAAVLRRLAGEGAFAEGWTVDRAADWAWSETHPARWQQLAIGRGWTADEIVAVTCSAFRHMLLR